MTSPGPDGDPASAGEAWDVDVRRQHDWDSEGNVGTAVTAALAESLDTEPTELTPTLYDTVDPAAINALFAPCDDGTERSTTGHVSFRYDERRVVVTSAGRIEIQRRTDRRRAVTSEGTGPSDSDTPTVSDRVGPTVPTFDAVLFDMDGVIVDSEDYWVDIEEETIFPEVLETTASADEITGMNYREIYDYLDEHHETTVEKSEFVDIYDEAAEDVYGEHAALMDGFRDIVADLRGDGVDVALVSSAPHDWIDVVLERFDLDFDAVVSAEDVNAPGKPGPAIYEHAADRLGHPPSGCVAVEDSENGVEAAVRAGADCVGYRNGAKELDLSAADAVVSDSEGLREQLFTRP
jgi:HAD superfamily hydrolase (TIGR01509 family)